ncbi:KAP family P-loop NTPase fold protein [Fodinibius sediminis]|uniref:KAP family P-loop domain-containing protein n=1 Tax=Fodinibius sediminis TaxID=1214077 RepID=A0A521FI10_9BACT|nr:P-loop NTPase fold protein [Fodinibius sediminis]SMO95847.1 KAP family P-loop domain-containing protein [Fodinibius sediminis]
MRLKSKGIEVDKKNPFANDKLGRENNIKILSSVVDESEDSFVLAVNAPYGQGKTTFLEMWKAYLESQDYPCLLYNAWENDYSDSPILTLIAEFEKQIKQKNLKVSEGSKKIFERAKSIGGSLIKTSIPLSLRLLTGGLLNISNEDVEKTISELLENTAKEGIDNYVQEQDDIRKFKEELSEFVASLNEERDTKLVIFVDELDRCKPSFAVHLLEEIKHIFDIKNIYFVLAVDSKQLENSLKSIYGRDLDVIGYLKRFIDLRYELPKAKLEDFIELQIDQYQLNNFFEKRQFTRIKNEKDYLLNTAVLLSRRFQLSLRDLEHLFRKVVLVLKTSQQKENIHPHLLLFLIVVKERDENMYQKFINGKIDVESLLEYLTIGFDQEEMEQSLSHNLNIIKSLFIWLLNPDYLDKFYNEEGKLKEDLPQDKRYEVSNIERMVQLNSRHIHFRRDRFELVEESVNLTLSRLVI